MKKIVSVVLIILFIFSLMGCKEEEPTPVILKEYQIIPYFTQGNKNTLLTEQPIVLTNQEGANRNTKITIDSTQLFQEMDGFGAAMTESSAYLFSQMSEEDRQTVLQDLFGEEGIGISFVRLPMGASDFALSNYSYSDLPAGETDLEMEHFTLERDQEYVIPMLKEMLLINPNVKIVASPWSAPGWMKTTGTMNGGSLKNEYMDAYVKYFVKFIQGYAAEGIEIFAVTPQNEPLHQTPNYPTMYMTAQQQLTFVIKLKEAFDAANIETLIITYDHNWDQPNYPMQILASPNGYDAVAGSGFHCYGGQVSAQAQVAENYPDKGIWFTECSGGGWATDFAANMTWNLENVFIGSINHFAKGVLMWNLALDDQDGPKNGGCPNCRGVVTIHEDGSYTKNEEYYFIGHFSAFVKQGATRIHTETTNINVFATAFKNPDGSLVVVAHNKLRSSSSINLIINGSKANVEIPASTSVTFVITEKA